VHHAVAAPADVWKWLWVRQEFALDFSDAFLEMRRRNIRITYRFKDNRVTGFEALARWYNNKFGWVAPDVFIPIAEEIGLPSELSDQILRQACIDAGTWDAELTLAFIISASQLRDHTLGPDYSLYWPRPVSVHA
jgi:EAL domain-containing protein (putative c-di-GMP-specific phosphodiesterase class I)